MQVSGQLLLHEEYTGGSVAMQTRKQAREALKRPIVEREALDEEANDQALIKAALARSSERANPPHKAQHKTGRGAQVDYGAIIYQAAKGHTFADLEEMLAEPQPDIQFEGPVADAVREHGPYTIYEILLVETYLQTFSYSATAERLAFPSRSVSSVLSRPKLKILIAARMKQEVMSADEVLGRLSMYARFNLADYLKVDESKNAAFPVMIDWEKLLEDGNTIGIKGIKNTSFGQEVITHDPMRALELIAKHLQLFRPDVSLNINQQTFIQQTLSGLEELTDDELRILAYNLSTTVDGHDQGVLDVEPEEGKSSIRSLSSGMDSQES